MHTPIQEPVANAKGSLFYLSARKRQLVCIADRPHHELILDLEIRYHDAVDRWATAIQEMCRKSGSAFWEASVEVAKIKLEAAILRAEIERLKQSISN